MLELKKSKKSLTDKEHDRVLKEIQMTKRHMRNIFILKSNRRNADENDMLFFNLSDGNFKFVKGSEGVVSKTTSGTVHWAQLF